MPCQSDYLAASGQELESKRVALLTSWLNKKLGKDTPAWICDAAKDYYGNVDRLDEVTKDLCAILRSLTAQEIENIVYNAHDSNARKLANWWQRHQEWDLRRVKEEKETRKHIITKERALRKLTNEEIIALNL